MPSIRHLFRSLSRRFTRFALLPLLLVLLTCPPAFADDLPLVSGKVEATYISSDGSTIVYEKDGNIYISGDALSSSSPLESGFLLGISADGSWILGGTTVSNKFLLSGENHTTHTTLADLFTFSAVSGISPDGQALWGRTAVDQKNLYVWVSSDNWATSGNVTTIGTTLENDVYIHAASNVNTGVITLAGDYASLPALINCSVTDTSITPITLNYAGYAGGTAFAITQNASIAVGSIADGSTDSAAKWDVAANTLTVLPKVGGIADYRATAVNSDGTVIVGNIANEDLNTDEAVYWRGSGGSYQGMTVYDALVSKGVTMDIADARYLQTADGVTGDGNIIIGRTFTDDLYFANISGTSAGVITLDQLNQSLGTMGQVGPAVTGMGQLSMSRLGGVAGGQGMHFAVSAPGPASGAPSAGTGSETGLSSGDEMPGRLDLWVVGTVGTNIELNGDDLGLHGGVGLTWERGEWRVGGGLFGDSRDLDTSYNGNQDIQAVGPGAFVAYTPEGTGLEFRVSGLWQTVDLDLKRGYANGAGYATSGGSTNADVFGLSGRVQWTRGVTDYLALTPFAEYTWQTTHIDGYSESGGPFPASFDSRDETSNSLRAGLRADAALLDKVATWAWIAWDHRFEDKSSGLGGTSLGLGAFSYSGARVDQDWADTGVGASWDITERLSANSSLGFALGCDDDTMSDLNVTLGFSYQLW